MCPEFHKEWGAQRLTAVMTPTVGARFSAASIAAANRAGRGATTSRCVIMRKAHSRCSRSFIVCARIRQPYSMQLVAAASGGDGDDSMPAARSTPSASSAIAIGCAAEHAGQLIYTRDDPGARDRANPDRRRLPRLPPPEMRRALGPADRPRDPARRFQDLERAVRLLGGLRGLRMRERENNPMHSRRGSKIKGLGGLKFGGGTVGVMGRDHCGEIRKSCRR
jgi:hypothetical protein